MVVWCRGIGFLTRPLSIVVSSGPWGLAKHSCSWSGSPSIDAWPGGGRPSEKEAAGLVVRPSLTIRSAERKAAEGLKVRPSVAVRPRRAAWAGRAKQQQQVW